MNKTEILNSIKSLAQSQGFYGRVLEQVTEHPEILDELEAQNFKDSVDMVMFFEC